MIMHNMINQRCKAAGVESYPAHQQQLFFLNQANVDEFVIASDSHNKESFTKQQLYLTVICFLFQHGPFLLVVTWNRTYTFVVFRYRVIFSPRLEFSPSCVVASSRKFQLVASQNYTLFAYYLIIRCLRYCDF